MERDYSEWPMHSGLQAICPLNTPPQMGASPISAVCDNTFIYINRLICILAALNSDNSRSHKLAYQMPTCISMLGTLLELGVSGYRKRGSFVSTNLCRHYLVSTVVANIRRSPTHTGFVAKSSPTLRHQKYKKITLAVHRSRIFHFVQ